MKQTKGAIGNLLNRYRAVLKKCHLLNTFGSLAVASMLVMGGAGVVNAYPNSSDYSAYPGREGYESEITVEDNINLTTGDSYPVFAASVSAGAGKVELTGETIYISTSGDAQRSAVLAEGLTTSAPEINLGAEGRTQSIIIESHGTGQNGALGIWAKGTVKDNGQETVGGKIVIKTNDLRITTSSNAWSYGIYAQNCTSTSSGDVASIDIDANNIYIDTTSADGGAPIVAMSQGKIDITGNLYVNTNGGRTPDAIVARGDAKVYINQDGTGNEIVQLNGNINFNYDGPTSGTHVDADVKIVLSGDNSFWNGNTSVSWNIDKEKGEVPQTGLLEVQNMELTLKDGAKWTPTLVEREENEVTNDGKVYNQGEDYLALNVLKFDQGIIDVNDGIKIEVEKLNGIGNLEGAGILNNNGTTVFESGTLGDLRAVNNGSLTLKQEMKTTITSLSGSGSVDNAGTLKFDGEAENNSIVNAGTLSVVSNTTTVNTLSNSGTINVGGDGSAATLAIRESWTEDVNADTTVGNLGTLSVDSEILLTENNAVKDGVQKVLVESGGTYEITGLREITVEQAKALKNALLDQSSGTLYLKDTTLTGLTPIAEGAHADHYLYREIQDLGVTVDQLLESTVDVAAADNTGVSGGFKNVDLLEGDTLVAKGKDLTLAGSTNGGNLINTSNGELGNLRIGKTSGSDKSGQTTTVTLGLLNEAHSGAVGDIIMNAGAENTANLHVYGDAKGQAHFKAGAINTSSTVDAYETVTVQGAKFTVDSIATNGGQPLDKMDIISGLVEVDGGDANLKDVTLNNGILQAMQTPATEETEASGGKISISGTLSGSGTVDAADTLTLTQNYQGAAGDAVTLIAGDKIAAEDTSGNYDLKKADGGRLDLIASRIAAGDIDATSITADKIYADIVSVDGGRLLVTENTDIGEPASTVASLTLENGASGTINATLNLKNDNGIVAVGSGAEGEAGSSLSVRDIDLKGGMLLASSDWGQTAANAAVENLTNGSVGVGQNAYVALGTKDRDWLPNVAGSLSKDGTEAALGIYKPIKIVSGEALVVNGTLVGTASGDSLHDAVTTAGADTATFEANTLLVINGADKDIAGSKAAISFANQGTVSVAEGAKLQITDVMEGQSYIIVDNATLGEGVTELAGWQGEIETNTDMITVSGVKYDATNNQIVTQESKLQDAHKVFPGLSDEMAGVVNDLYTTRTDAEGNPVRYANPESGDLGIRFLSRATDKGYLGGDHAAAASTIESAARIAFAGAVPQMTKMASDSATNSVVNRMGFANPENGAKAMNVDGKLVDDKALGLALWIAPLWSNQTGFGMEAGNLDYGYNANIGGISLGADYTWANNFRAGLMFNIGGGYAESSGDLSETTNSMTFWGVGAYGGWKYENFAVMGDVSYTSTWNSVDQDVDHRMGMGDLEADIQASAISAGLRFEYKLETQYLDLIPHVGARYMSINTWGYDVDSADGTVLEGDGFQQNIWTFPVGITFSKELEMNNDWYFKPSVDFTVIPAAGDIKAKEDVRFTGLPYSTEVETQMMDYFTWQGGVGLEFGNENMSVGVNYTLQAGQNSTGHGVFGMFRYEF